MSAQPTSPFQLGYQHQRDGIPSSDKRNPFKFGTSDYWRYVNGKQSYINEQRKAAAQPQPQECHQ